MRIKKLLLGLLVGIFTIVNVDALSLELSSNKNSIKTGDNAEFTVKLKDIGENVFDLVEFEVDFNKDVTEFAELNKENFGTQQKYSNNKAFITELSNKFTNGESIASFLIKNISLDSGNTTIKLKNITFKKGNEVVGTADEVSKSVNLVYSTTTTTSTTTMRAKNTSAKVKNITFKNATMKPAFNKDQKEYKLYTKDTIRQLVINYDTEESGVVLTSKCNLGCSIPESSNNIIQLVQGKNEVEFTFTSEDGKNSEVYNFTIYRGETTDGSNKLSSLSVKDFTLNEEFNNEVLDYTLTVPFSEESITVDAAPEDAAADVKIKGADELEVGENTITITVTPTNEDTEVKIYNIKVTREEFAPVEDENQTPNEIIDDKQEKNSNILIIVIVVIGLLIIGVSAYFIFFYKPKKKKPTMLDETTDLPKVKSTSVIDQTFEEKEPTSIEDALEDLMKTKEINKDINDDNYENRN